RRRSWPPRPAARCRRRAAAGAALVGGLLARLLGLLGILAGRILAGRLRALARHQQRAHAAVAAGARQHAAHAGVHVDLGGLAVELVVAMRQLDVAADRRRARLGAVYAAVAAGDRRRGGDEDV